MSSWAPRDYGARKRRRENSLGVAALISWGGPANGFELVQFEPRPPIAKGVSAFLRLVAGAPPAVMKRINNVFDVAEARMREVAASCKGGWDRKTSVTMAGPRYLRVLASDDFFCGGSYPDDSNLALVFDLVTGSLVDWGKLLPELAKTQRSTTGANGAALRMISSPRLQELYKDGAKPDEDCASALDLDQRDFIVWLNAKAPGLVV